MLEKEFIDLFSIKTGTMVLNFEDLKFLTGYGEKRLEKNITLINQNYLLNPKELVSLNTFDLRRINQEKIVKDYYTSFGLPDEIRKMLLFLVIYVGKEAYSVIEIQEILEVSRNTVLSDIKKLNKKLAKISIKYDRSYGYYLAGKELEIRKQALYYVFNLYKHLQDNFLDLTIISNESLKEWEQKIFKAMTNENIPLMTGQLTEILLFINLTIERKKYVKNTEVSISAQYLPNSQLITFCQMFEKITVNKQEIEYIACLFAAISQAPLISENSVIYTKFNEFLTKLTVLSGIDFLNDQLLVNKLKNHCIPMIFREKYFQFLANHEIEAICDANQALFNVIQEGIVPIESILLNSVSKTEIGYLVAIIESHLQMQQKEPVELLKAIIICPNGTTSSVLLKNELENLFPTILFSKASSIHNFLKADQDEYDIIFSTFPIKTSRPLYVVSNFLTNFEKRKLEREINQRFHLPEIRLPSFQEIVPILANHSIKFEEKNKFMKN